MMNKNEAFHILLTEQQMRDAIAYWLVGNFLDYDVRRGNITTVNNFITDSQGVTNISFTLEPEPEPEPKKA